jgi:hypothetical protein
MRSTSVRALFAAVLALVLFGCSVEHRVTGPLPWQPQPPVADSPTNAIRLFEWGWNHRGLGVFENLLTDDFRFVFALGDSAGNAFRDDPFGREDMLVCLERLFTGGGSMPPATRIHLVLDPTLHALPDSRPGRNPGWHKEIVTSVDLAIMTEDGAEYRIMGNARFFVVRGDSALIPQELGLAPDSTRWFIQQWNDETLSEAGSAGPSRAVPRDLRAPQPAHTTTWGQILTFYYWVRGASRR